MRPAGVSRVTGLDAALVLCAGVAAGTINAVVGSGTLITFPTLVALGVPPLAATVSNAVGLVPGGLASTWGYRRELHGQGRRLRLQVPAAAAGSVIGALLLVLLPAASFEAVVPYLIVVAVGLVVAQPWLTRWLRRRGGGPASHPRRTAVLLVLGAFGIGVYGGYFTAAQGVLQLAVLGVLLDDDLQRISAAKNVLTLVVNLVAATLYLTLEPGLVDWTAVALIAAGSVVGGTLGASVGRRLPATVMRGAIVVLGLVALIRIVAS